MKLLKEYQAGKIFEKNGFLVPVLSGSSKEMGIQYGALMVDHMQQAWDVIAEPQVKKGLITNEVIHSWVERAFSTASIRNKLFYEGVAQGSGWLLNKVIMLDQVMEFGVFQAKLHSFAGCTSTLSWGSDSVDGGMYIGRNMDWSPEFCEFPTVLTVRKPHDGSLKLATVGWPGMYCAFTAMNEKGVYLDVHDGTSMGGSVVFFERPSMVNLLTDFMSESTSLSPLLARLNGTLNSTSIIFSLADEKRGVSMECSSLSGNRLRIANGDSIVIVNSFLGQDWGIGKRDTVSNSLKRYSNMNARLAECKGKVNTKAVQDMFDLRLFNDDGTFAEKGGATKPTNQDVDLTNHTVVSDINRRKMWIKIPVPEYFTDWTEFDLNELWQ